MFQTTSADTGVNTSSALCTGILTTREHAVCFYAEWWISHWMNAVLHLYTHSRPDSRAGSVFTSISVPIMWFDGHFASLSLCNRGETTVWIILYATAAEWSRTISCKAWSIERKPCTNIGELDIKINIESQTARRQRKCFNSEFHALSGIEHYIGQPGTFQFFQRRISVDYEEQVLRYHQKASCMLFPSPCPCLKLRAHFLYFQ